MSEYTLLTGPTGLLGRYLLVDLLKSGKRIALVARAGKKESITQRIESILQSYETKSGQLLSRPICFEGDITKPFLGLNPEERQWLFRNCNTVIHSAAALKFFEEANGEPWRSNVDGTRHVLQLCKEANIINMHYVSTAYVCGLRTGRIMEEQLDLGQDFRNDYEKSKLQAEKLVRNDSHLNQVTVYRPAVIAGDSQTGFTNTYHGLFMYLQIMSLLARNTPPGPDGIRHTPLQLRITGEEPRNVIPVDWTSSVITHLFNSPEAHGKTFHLAPDKKMTARQMVEAGCAFYNSSGVEFLGTSSEPSPDSLERIAYDNSKMYREYEASDPDFDTTNLEQYAKHLPCPEIDQDMLCRFIQFGEDDRWGKRRTQPAHIPIQLADFFENLNLDKDSSVNQAPVQLGLDIIGPGGGQWTLTCHGNQLTDCKTGLLVSSSETIQLKASQFSKSNTPLLISLQEAMKRYASDPSLNGQRKLASQLADSLLLTVAS